MSAIISIWLWVASTVLVVAWCPAMVVRRLFDRDPTHFGTGLLFRKLGVALTRLNPFWKIEVVGAEKITDPRNPYVFVSNHQSMADIPVLAHLPGEMKWMTKKELFSVPFLGWMLRLAGDIRVDRDNPRAAVQAIRRARWYLENNCSVMIFPEGTRSPDGEVKAFHDGAFRLAVDTGVPILPVVVEGTFDCLPKEGWRFGTAADIKVMLLDPVETGAWKRGEVPRLRDLVRDRMRETLDQLRGRAV